MYDILQKGFLLGFITEKLVLSTSKVLVTLLVVGVAVIVVVKVVITSE